MQSKIHNTIILVCMELLFKRPSQVFCAPQFVSGLAPSWTDLSPGLQTKET